jgi:protein-S-isoprenylcysteine O-methyltransferase Ste14
MSDDKRPTQPPTIGIKLFGRTLALTGRSAEVVGLLVLVSLVALVVYFAIKKPESFKAALMSPLALSGGLWLMMIVYWSAAAKGSAPVATSEPAASRSRHQMLLNAALLLAFIRFPGLGARWLPATPVIVPIGLAIQVGSMILDVWSMRCLGRNWSGAVTIKVGHELVRTGPYRLVRHPIYTAMIGMYLGTAIISGEVHGLLAVVLCGYAYWRKTRMEERGLIDVFGQAYEDYKRVTWALIPWVF